MGGVLEQVDEHLLDEELIDGHERQIRGQRGGDRVLAQRFVEPQQGDTERFLQWLPFALDGKGTRFDANHVQQVHHEGRHASRFAKDRLGELAAIAVGQGGGLQERARRALDARERRAKVVRK